MRRQLLALAFALPLAGLTACEDATTRPQPQVIEEVTFASTLGVDLAASTKTSTGVYWRDLTPGTGATLAAGDSAFVRYSGYLANGSQFDSNESAGRPLLGFKYGQNPPEMIAGFEAGLAGIKVGGRRQIIIPSSQGYGNVPQPGIPGGSVLVFNVTLSAKKP